MEVDPTQGVSTGGPATGGRGVCRPTCHGRTSFGTFSPVDDVPSQEFPTPGNLGLRRHVQPSSPRVFHSVRTYVYWDGT